MSGESSPKKLTVEDPIEVSTLENLEKLDDAWMELSVRNAQLDQEKVHILGNMKRIDTERARIFEEIQMERGLSPLARIQIDPKTRMVSLVSEPGSEPES